MRKQAGSVHHGLEKEHADANRRDRVDHPAGAEVGQPSRTETLERQGDGRHAERTTGRFAVPLLIRGEVLYQFIYSVAAVLWRRYDLLWNAQALEVALGRCEKDLKTVPELEVSIMAKVVPL